MAEYKCNSCGGTMFSYVNKDAAHIGVYCSNCGKWLKWAGKKEYANKSIIPYTVFMDQIKQNNTITAGNVQNNDVDVTNNKGVCQHINNGNVQSQAVNNSVESVQVVEPAKPAAQRVGKLEYKLAPRGDVIITANTGEQAKYSNVLIKATASGLTLYDVTGAVIRTFSFE